ncbi:uncharacterized protein LOC142518725 [Primulina tabacum]|uniref:uncharacterized protein LOC142518725 n=1 Tax=Primulina tabacum TaxID=48773 RepID=UPI003F5AD461
MDFKGVAWAGDVYQKFEAMCLEVEEVMYQDTVKYVENQAQKVGASVKKFYSEVMLDLLPSSCVDPVKVATGDLSLNPYAHTDLSKKPKSFLLDSPRELKKIKTEDETISDTILPPLSSGVLVQNTSSDLCSSKSKKLGVYRRPIGIKRISQLDRPSKVASPAASSLGLGSSESASCGSSGSHMKASSDMNLKSSSDSVESRDTERVKESSPVSEAKIKSSVTDKLISAGSARQKKDESECTSSLGTPVNGTLISQTGLSNTTNACNTESAVEKITTSDEDTSKKNDSFFESFSDIRSSTCNVGFPVEEVVLSNKDNFDMEVIQNEEVAEPSIETFEAFEVSNLEETCVFVEGGNLDFVSLGNRKHKSYKKKIRDALSSKLRPTRKELHKDFGGKNNPEESIPALSTESGLKQKITDHDSLESEWELL